MGDYITMTEAAKILGLSLFTLNKKLTARGIEKTQDPIDGRRWLVLRSDVEALRALPNSPKPDGQPIAA